MIDNRQIYKLAISDFQNFELFKKYLKKKWNFLKILHFFVFRNFWKTGIYMLDLEVVHLHAKFQAHSFIISGRRASKAPIYVCYTCVQYRPTRTSFFGLNWRRKPKIMLPSCSWDQIGLRTCVICLEIWPWKFDLFDLYISFRLTWPLHMRPEYHKYPFWTMPSEGILKNGVITCVARLCSVILKCWPYVTWHDLTYAFHRTKRL